MPAGVEERLLVSPETGLAGDKKGDYKDHRSQKRSEGETRKYDQGDDTH